MSWKPDCSIPDHSLLICDINPVEFYYVNTSHDKGGYNGTFPYSKEYYFDKIPLDFMNNDTINRKVTDIRMDANQLCDTKSSVNNVYKGFGEILNSEMLCCLKKVNKSHKSHRTRRRFWDDKLNELYKLSNQAEKDFCNYKGHKEGRITLHKEFKAKRKEFDIAFRKAKRMYMRKIELELESMVTNNGKEMWRKVVQLGKNRKYNSKIPTQVVINGRISTNIEQILIKWKDDFSSLYQIKPVDTEGPNKDFMNRVKEALRKLDDGKLGQAFEFNPISEAEIIYEKY